MASPPTRWFKCACDAMYQGCSHDVPCPTPVTDDHWGPWCKPCNKQRFAHIDRNLKDIAASFGEGGISHG